MKRIQRRDRKEGQRKEKDRERQIEKDKERETRGRRGVVMGGIACASV